MLPCMASAACARWCSAPSRFRNTLGTSAVSDINCVARRVNSFSSLASMIISHTLLRDRVAFGAAHLAVTLRKQMRISAIHPAGDQKIPQEIVFPLLQQTLGDFKCYSARGSK